MERIYCNDIERSGLEIFKRSKRLSVSRKDGYLCGRVPTSPLTKLATRMHRARDLAATATGLSEVQYDA